jgi:hypothetical protein
VPDPEALVNAMLPAPKAIDRVFELLELKIPVLRVKPARLRVPCVKVTVVVFAHVTAPLSVTVIPAPLIVMGPTVLPALVNVPDPTKFVVPELQKFPPVAQVRLPAIFTAPPAVPALPVKPVKLTFLNQLAGKMSTRPPPVPTVRFGALDAVPPLELPNRTSSVAGAPVPVQVKLVALGMFRCMVPDVRLKRIFPEPKEIARVLELVEAKAPVVKLKLLRASVPAVNPTVDVACVTNADARVTVPPDALIVIEPNVLLALVIVAVALIVIVPV